MIRKDEKTDKKDYPGEKCPDSNHKGGRMKNVELPKIVNLDPTQEYYVSRLGLFAGSLHRAVKDASALKADVEMKLIPEHVAKDQLEHYRLSIMEDVESISVYAKNLGLLK